MGKFTVAKAANGNRIAGFPAGEAFLFSGSRKGNNGLCIRVADSKKGKGRFVNVATGKLLTAGARDVGAIVDVNVEYDAS